MGLISSVASGIESLLTSALAKIAADDVKEWAPDLATRLIHAAVGKLPEAQRERYLEEWTGHVAEAKGTLGKLWVALGLQVASVRMAGACAVWPAVQQDARVVVLDVCHAAFLGSRTEGRIASRIEARTRLRIMGRIARRMAERAARRA